MKKILSLVLALSMILALVPAAVAETETDWSKEEKFTINWTQYFVAPPQRMPTFTSCWKKSSTLTSTSCPSKTATSWKC